MHISILVTVFLIGIGYALHLVRLKVHLKRLMAQYSDRFLALQAEKASAEQKAEELSRLDTIKSQVLAGQMNGLRTPLTLLSTAVQTQGDNYDSGAGDQRNTQTSVLQCTQQITFQLEQISEVLEVELGNQTLNRHQVDFNKFVGNEVYALKPHAEKNNVILSFEACKEDVVLSIDPAKTRLAISGLLYRAFESTSEGDAIRLYLTKKCMKETGDEYAVLEIRDTGRPIQASHSTLLRQHTRWSTEMETMKDVLGLSLALTRNFIDLHGGKVNIDDSLLVGTRIQTLWPIPEEVDEVNWSSQEGDGYMTDSLEFVKYYDAQHTQFTQNDSSQSTEKKETTVLVVDDHPGTRGYLAYALSKYHNVLEASNGKEALDLVKQYLPDLVVSDVMMPLMNGHELCRAIKMDPALSHIPIFMVTADAIPSTKKESLVSGADDYLVKPFDMEEAALRISNMIKVRGQLRQRYTKEVLLKPSEIQVSSAEERFLVKARDLVEENMEDGNFGVQELASELGLSPRQLQRKLRETVGQSPVGFIRTLRLYRAAQLLEQQAGNVSEVAYAVGFTSLSYFAKCFREQFGTSPSEYKTEQSLSH